MSIPPIARRHSRQAVAKLTHRACARRAVFLCLLFLPLAAALIAATPAHATSHCQFVLGFKTLRDLIGHGVVGECLENEHYNATGDSVQQTSGGLLVWRKADNWTAFTDGYRTWLNGPYGLQQRLNTERFEWEADYADFAPAAATPALTREALRNAEYQLYQEKVRLRDGVLARKLEIGQEIWLLHDRIAFGDLNNDGVNDAAVVLSYNGGGSGTFYNLLAVRNDNGVPVHIASYSIGDRIRLDALEIAAGVITVRMVAHGPNDAACCPTQDTIATFRLSGSGFELLSEVPPGQLTATLKRDEGPAIDPTLAHAFHVMRSTSIGNEVAEKFVRLSASAQFGLLEGSISRYSSASNAITISEVYRQESPEALAYTLIWPTIGLSLFSDSGAPKSWEACMLRIIGQHVTQAQWWQEKFGANGKQNPTQLERGANSTLASYRDGRLEGWVRSYDPYREHCAHYGEPPPVPTATPVPSLTLPWDYLEIDLGNLLEKEGYTRGSAAFSYTYNHLSGKYGYLPHSLFLAWLDAGGRGVGDATPELWQDFYRAFLFNQEFRRTSIVSVGQYLKANTHLGPVLTAFLKAEHIGTYEERVLFVASVQNAMLLSLPRWMADRIGGTRDCLSTPSCNRVWFELRGSLDGKDLSALPAIPSPWYKN